MLFTTTGLEDWITKKYVMNKILSPAEIIESLCQLGMTFMVNIKLL